MLGLKNIFCLLSIIFSVSANVPVLLWESSAISDKDDITPALHQLDSDEFLNHVTKKVHLQKPLILVFLEESLSVEDLSWRNDRGQGSFPQVHNITSSSAKTELLTSVGRPMEALQEMSKSQGYEWRKYDAEEVTKPGQIVVVRLDDPLPEEDRPDFLGRHDATIAKIYSQLLSRSADILAMLTGRTSSWVEPDYNRVRREADMVSTTMVSPEASEESDSSQGKTLVAGTESKIKISFPSVPLLTTEDFKEEPLSKPNKPTTDFKKNSKEMSLIVSYIIDQKKYSTKYRFQSNPEAQQRWKLADITLQGAKSVTLKPKDEDFELSGAVGKSFNTRKPVEFVGEGVSLRFPEGLQLQAFMKSAEFDDAEVKYQYFTIAIMMGLFVTLILGAILTWGLIMMMDIKTMDRFDDPKGKTITVAQGD